jgi:hypothetical protein
MTKNVNTLISHILLMKFIVFVELVETEAGGSHVR